MPDVVIDIYDSGVLVSDGKQILADSASCALIESSNRIIVGSAAQQQAHLRPREVSTNYWSSLSSKSETRYAISNAEIAYIHLQQVWKQANVQDHGVLISVPNTFSKSDLGLLLGITEKLSIPVRGIACNAVLAQSAPLQNCVVIFLDLQQTSLTLSEIIHNENEISVDGPKKVFNYGLQTLQYNIAESIAKKFIADTRFDPLHLAEDEQQFFNILPAWLSALNSAGHIDCKVSTDTHQHSIRLEKQHLNQTNNVLFNHLSSYLSMEYHNQDAITIICSATCKDVYGLVDFLQKLPGCAIKILNKQSIVKQFLLQQAQVQTQDQQIHYTTSLICNKNITPIDLNFSTGSLSELRASPTHILINDQAHLLKDALYLVKNSHGNSLTIKRINSEHAICKITKTGFHISIEALSNDTFKLNNSTIDDNKTIQIGDCLNVEGYLNNARFIKVNKHEA